MREISNTEFINNKDPVTQLPGDNKFEKRDHDKKALTLIDEKVKEGIDLNKDELKFLYEVDNIIECFDHQKDPRIKEIINQRDIKKDLAIALDCSPDQIVDKSSQITEDTKACYGGLNKNDVNMMNHRQNPLFILGDSYFNGCTSLISIPKNTIFNGGAYFGGCTSLRSIPENTIFNGYVNFVNCASLISIPENTIFNGDAYFDGCTSLKSIPENTIFNGIVSFRDCTSLTTIANNTIFNGDTSFYGCTLLTSIPENTIFNGYTSFTSCNSLTSIPKNTVFNGDVSFRRSKLNKNTIEQLRQMKKDGKITGELFF